MLNPFDYTSPVRQESLFFGRQRLRRMVDSLLIGGASGLTIYGPRRIGTSSAINYALSAARNLGKTTVYVDCRLLPTPLTGVAFGDEVAFQLGFGRSQDELMRVDQWPPQHGNGVVIGIDEFDAAQPDDAHDILGWLHHMHYMGDMRDIAYWNVIVGSRRPLWKIEGEHSRASPFYASFFAFPMEPLSETEAKSMAHAHNSGSGVLLDNEINWLISLAGSWPFFLTLACHHTWDYKVVRSLRELTRKDKSNLEGLIWLEALPYLHMQLETMSFSQREILRSLDATKLVTSTKSIKFDEDIYPLIHYGYCKPKNRKLVYSCVLFREFYSSQSAPYLETNLIDKAELYKLLTGGRFALEDLDDLCFRMGVDIDLIGGDTVPERARRLIDYLDRRNKLSKFRSIVDAARPDLN